MKFSTAFASFAVALIGFASTASALPYEDTPAGLSLRDFIPELLEVRYPFHDDDIEFPRELLDFYEDLAARVYEDQSISRRDFNFDEIYGRDFDDEMLEARHPVVRIAVQGIKAIVKAIKNGIQRDKDARSKFTPELVNRIRGQYPGFNVVVCHTKHDKQFDGTEGKDWGHLHEEFDIKIGGTIGYEIYWFKKGVFIRKGDGGYLNWAYSGKVAKTEDGGKRVFFDA